MTIDERLERFEHHATEKFEQLDRFRLHATEKFEQLDRFQVHVTQEFQRLDAKIDGVNSSLRVLIEDNRSQQRLLAEAVDTLRERSEVRHAEVMDVLNRVAGNHEARLTRLETHTGLA